MSYYDKYMKYKSKYLNLFRSEPNLFLQNPDGTTSNKNKLKYLKKHIGGGINNNEDCAICNNEPYGSDIEGPMNAQVNSNDHVELDCGHVFHYQCILDMIDATYTPAAHINCPLCNKKIDNIYNVSPDLSSLPDGERVQRLTTLYSSQQPIIRLAQWEEYKTTPEYARKRGASLAARVSNETPAEKRRRLKTIWEQRFFEDKDVLFTDASNIESLYGTANTRYDFYTNLPMPILTRVVAIFELERKILNLNDTLGRFGTPNERKRIMDDFSRRYDEVKDRLFIINPESNPAIDREYEQEYQEIFLNQNRNISTNYNIHDLMEQEQIIEEQRIMDDRIVRADLERQQREQHVEPDRQRERELERERERELEREREQEREMDRELERQREQERELERQIERERERQLERQIERERELERQERELDRLIERERHRELERQQIEQEREMDRELQRQIEPDRERQLERQREREREYERQERELERLIEQERERELERQQREQRERGGENEEIINAAVEILNSEWEVGDMITMFMEMNLHQITQGNYGNVYSRINNPDGVGQEALDTYRSYVEQMKYMKRV
jgi:hypothetical protein